MKPVELYIPHHINTTNMSERDSLFLLTAEDVLWDCINFTQNSTINVEINSLFAKIATTHFCSNCIATNGKKYREIPKRYSIARADKVDDEGILTVEFIFIYQENGCKKVSFIFNNISLHTQMIEKQCASNGFKIKKYKTYLPSSEQDKCVLSLEPKSVPGWIIGPSPDQVSN